VRPSRLFYGFEAQEVLDPQEWIKRESLLSWIARTAVENDLPHVTTITRDVGQAHRHRLVDVIRQGIDVEGLAVILGGHLPTVESLRGGEIGNGMVRYLGAKIRTSDLHTEERRFAPASLADDNVPFYRDSWLIRTFPVCTETWQTLRTVCDCGTVQTWATVSSLVLCEGCGEDLRDLSSDFIPPERRAGLQFLADILFGEDETRDSAMARLPEKLRVLDPGDVFELAILMSRIVDPAMGNPRHKVWRNKPLRFAMALSRAGEFLPLWPETPWLALDAAGDAKAMNGRSRALFVLSHVLCGKLSRNVSKPIAALIDEIRDEITIDDDANSHLVDLHEAYRILRVRKKQIRAERAAGHLGSKFVIRRGEVLPGFERTMLESLAAAADWPCAAVAGKRLGLASYAVEQLCALGELVWAKAPEGTLRKGLRVDPDSVAGLERALRGAASPIDELSDDPVSLTRTMRGIGGREKPWGTVLRYLLAGEWRYALRHEGSVVREICVSRADVEAIRGAEFNPSDYKDFAFAGTLDQADACDILNVAVRNRHQIKAHKIGVRNRAWSFDRADVARLAADIVTGAELGSRYLLENRTALAAIRRADLKDLEFGFERASAIQKFAAALS